MLGDAIDGERKRLGECGSRGRTVRKKGESGYLFDHTTWFELVRVGQATDEASFPCPVEPHAFTLGAAEGGGFISSRLRMAISGVWICRVVTRFRAEGGPTFFCFSVEKEIA